jgi:hypothetical protein
MHGLGRAGRSVPGYGPRVVRDDAVFWDHPMEYTGVVRRAEGNAIRPDVAKSLAATRAKLADAAEMIAARAEEVATTLERAAARGDSERRMRLAAWERETARIQRRNAAALRGGEDAPPLEHLPPRPD